MHSSKEHNYRIKVSFCEPLKKSVIPKIVIRYHLQGILKIQ